MKNLKEITDALLEYYRSDEVLFIDDTTTRIYIQSIISNSISNLLSAEPYIAKEKELKLKKMKFKNKKKSGVLSLFKGISYDP